jgi:hypothetical protein
MAPISAEYIVQSLFISVTLWVHCVIKARARMCCNARICEQHAFRTTYIISYTTGYGKWCITQLLCSLTYSILYTVPTRTHELS